MEKNFTDLTKLLILKIYAPPYKEGTLHTVNSDTKRELRKGYYYN